MKSIFLVCFCATSFFGQGGNYSELDLHGIMIYDTKAGQFVSNQG
jgi:hypothetical protein